MAKGYFFLSKTTCLQSSPPNIVRFMVHEEVCCYQVPALRLGFIMSI